MTADLLGLPLTPTEADVLTVYDALKALTLRTDLPPTAQSNLRDALASTSIVVTGLCLGYENLIDHGC